ncbi:uncharacterized protein LOC116922301 [Daphnia magna]|uniref:uncharacterized protein LOC116922301 n=1 Tax=Daphnia magna TaxID=35525 RepID=UPI001E1BD723|nr:uncharacterized protein LOC116922301 [Daphnia magna]
MVNSSSRPIAAVDSGFENVRSSPNGRSSVLSSTDSGFGSYYTAPREIAKTPSLLTSSIGVGGAFVRYEPAAEKNTMEFHRSILKQLAKLSQNSALQASIIEARMNDIDAKLKAFVDQPHERRAEVDAATTSVVMPTLSIPSMEMLLTFEDMLINDDIRFELSRIVKAGGGITLADAVKRAWLKSLSLQVRALCYWCGKPRKGIQKHKLKGSRVTGAVFRGIRSITQFKNSTDAELEHETKKVFKHGPERARNHRAHGDDDDDDDDRGNILERPVAGKSTRPSDPRPPRAGGSTSI